MHYFCLALFAWAFFSRALFLGARKESWRRRAKRKESLEITLPKPVWFHADVKVVLVLEEKGGPEILQ